MPEIKTPIHIRVLVKAFVSKESVEQLSEIRYAIAVREPAEGNRANARVIEIVRRLYPKSRIKLIAGHHASRKTFEIL